MSDSNLAIDYDMSDLEIGKPSSPSKNAKMEATEEPPVSNDDKPDDPSDPRIVEIIEKELSSLCRDGYLYILQIYLFIRIIIYPYCYRLLKWLLAIHILAFHIHRTF